MDFVAFLRLLLRRWAVVLTGLMLTALVSLAASRSVAPVFEARGSVLLLGPATNTSSEGGAVPINPYLNMNPSVQYTGLILAERMNSEEVVRQLADAGATAEYEVTGTEKTPILTVEARGPNRAQVHLTAQLVLAEIGEELAVRQQAAGAPAHSLIRSQLLTPPRPSMRTGSALRVMGAVGALGLGTTFLFVLFIESLATRRDRRRELETPLSTAEPVLIGSPPASASPRGHPASTGAVAGNGVPPRPPAGPLVEVLVPTARSTRHEERSEGPPARPVRHERWEGPTARPVRREERSEGATAREEPAGNGDLEQHDRVGSWWNAWAHRQAGRQAEQVVEDGGNKAGDPAGDRPDSPDETHEDHTGTDTATSTTATSTPLAPTPAERREQESAKGDKRPV